MEVLLAVSESGGCTSTEHVPTIGTTSASIWVLPQSRHMMKCRGWKPVHFAECNWGSRKCQQNCIAGDLKGLEGFRSENGALKCLHPSRPVFGWSNGARSDQNSTQFCEFLGKCVVETWKARPVTVRCKPIGPTVPDLGDRVPSPEVSGTWDPIERWTESARWVWGKEEHNNILEARAGVVSAKLASMVVENWNKRMIIISDSQVTIGVFGKGRSSTLVLNLLARRMAALTMATGMKFYWRYMRTHRNHADGPSRGYPIGHAPPDGKEEGENDTGSEQWWKQVASQKVTETNAK